jgi:hypothetical protein
MVTKTDDAVNRHLYFSERGRMIKKEEGTPRVKLLNQSVDSNETNDWDIFTRKMELYREE